jgi:transcriptional regulator with XRE-family HTH domain
MPRDQLSSAQIRAARALIGLSTKELAELSGVGWATIRRFEQTEGVPPSRAGTLERLKECLEDAGIEFLGDPVSSPGVRLKRPKS